MQGVGGGGCITCSRLAIREVEMKSKENKHVIAFRTTKLKPGENIEFHLEGWIGDMMGKGKDAQRNGQFLLTDQRVCFYRKGMLGEVFETIPLAKSRPSSVSQEWATD